MPFDGFPSLGARKHLWGFLHDLFSLRTTRVDRASATLPQTGNSTLFTITGGNVMAYIIGEVTVVLGATATNAKLIHDPLVGTDFDICAVLAIASKEVGVLFGITGVPADAMLGAGQAVRFQNPVVMKPGNILLNTSANNTGQVKWSLLYVPVDDGALVVAG